MGPSRWHPRCLREALGTAKTIRSFDSSNMGRDVEVSEKAQGYATVVAVAAVLDVVDPIGTRYFLPSLFFAITRLDLGLFRPYPLTPRSRVVLS